MNLVSFSHGSLMESNLYLFFPPFHFFFSTHESIYIFFYFFSLPLLLFLLSREWHNKFILMHFYSVLIFYVLIFFSHIFIVYFVQLLSASQLWNYDMTYPPHIHSILRLSPLSFPSVLWPLSLPPILPSFLPSFLPLFLPSLIPPFKRPVYLHYLGEDVWFVHIFTLHFSNHSHDKLPLPCLRLYFGCLWREKRNEKIAVKHNANCVTVLVQK